MGLGGLSSLRAEEDDMKRRIRLPSPAMVVALAALVTSAGGTVTAAALITSANIKNNTIRTVDVRNGTIKGIDVKNNSLTGTDVKESTLGQVPSAANATNAATAASAANAQNADQLDGLDANGLTRVARMGTGATLTLTTSQQTYGTPLTITAPGAGFVMIHGNVTVLNTSCVTSCGYFARVRHIQSGALSTFTEESIAPGQLFANTSHAWVFPVAAGVNTFDIRIARDTTNGTMSGWFGELAAIYSPFGSTGAGTLATQAAAVPASKSPIDE
jgi:hypothetical protein